ncbi:MAG: hypothetical protein JSW43_08750 [Gemmatimonadota bacterium]|nr:MAG: hypothetical protein JSW43_08750 [Gemmatimonadota bacterium]
MGMLLFLVGLLAAVSGGVKLRKRIRTSVGTSALARVELAVGSLVVLGSGVGLSKTALAPWAVAATLLLMVASAIDQGRRATRAQRHRDRSEGARLKTFLQGDGKRR